MSAVEEAASLFGAADTANDPFAATVAETTEPSDIHSGSELFSGQTYEPAADIFSSDVSSETTAGYGTAVTTNGTAEYANTQSRHAVSQSSYDYPTAPAPVNTGPHAQQSYGNVVDSKRGGYSSYEPAQAHYSTNGQYYSSAQYTNAYDPSSQYTYTANASVYSPPAQSQKSYDSYTSAQAAAPNPLAVYDPYKPTQDYAPKQPQLAPDISPAYPPVPAEPKSQPSLFAANVPPPLPSASAYRPKTRNAYDPPLPPPKPSKRSHAWQTQISPDVGTPSALPNAGIQPVLSPPPPPRSAGRQYTPPASYAPVPGSSSDRRNTLSPQLGALSTGTYAPSTQWSPPSSYQPFEQSKHAPTEQPTTSEQQPSAELEPVAAQKPYWNGQHQPGFHPPAQSETVSRTSVSSSQTIDSEAPEDVLTQTDGHPGASLVESVHSGHATTVQHVNGVEPSVPSTSYQPVSNGHASPSRQQSPVRTKSPGNASVRSWASGKRNIIASSPPVPETSHRTQPRSIYDPPIIPSTTRTSSPSVMSVRSGRSVIESYAPGSVSSDPARDRSMSNASLLSVGSSGRDPYAPSLHAQSRQQSVDETLHGSSLQTVPPDSPFVPSSYGSQTSSVAASHTTNTLYAPSPSLLGTNDPLGRTSARVPVISFGFGGKVVTCFHGSSSLHTGFDVALSSRLSTDVHLRVLHEIIPDSALNVSSAQFPGPLFSDPGAQSTSIIGAGAAAQTKAKKSLVIKYLEERAEELSQGMGYLHHGNTEGQQAQAKHILIKLLRVMVENDGRLSGSPQIDAAVRAALVPHISTKDIPTDGLKTAVSLGFPRTSDSHPALADLPTASYPSLPSLGQDVNDTTVSVHTLRSSNLDRIQELLIRGERRAAFQYAADERLWAHAMVIASSIDKEAWKEVVNEFVRTELAHPPSATSEMRPSALDGRESLRVAYSLFAGQGAAAVQEFLPPKPLANTAQPLQPLQPLQALQPLGIPAGLTPMTPNFSLPVSSVPIPPATLSKWPETAAMMISSPLSAETSAALTALGDQLAANGWIEAGHVCYILSPQTSPFGGVGAPSCRVHLLGASPGTVPNYWKDPDAIVFSEVVEFALSLTPQVKGHDAFSGLPHLQAYRLIRAMGLAELGHDQQANRYCEAISISVNRPSPYIHSTLIGQLRGLADRLVAAPHGDKSGSWIGSKMAKPSLDKFGNWLEGRFTSFIAGDADSPQAEEAKAKDRTFSGPFTHYSTISSATSSSVPSPQMSSTDITEIPPTAPSRAGSAMALRSSAGYEAPMNRAASAMDYIRRKASPVPRVPSAGAASTIYANAASFPYTTYGYGSNGVTNKVNQGLPDVRLAEVNSKDELSPETPSNSNGSWWGVSDSGVPTPTATSFVNTEVTLSESAEGFISLMDDATLSVTPSPAPTSFSRNASMSTKTEVDIEDDLGLGNPSHKAKAIEKTATRESQTSTAESANESKRAEDKPELKQTSSGGWLSRLWGRSDKPAPIKANLGEQTTFYYDKELKRWVNKTSGTEPAKPSAPPPPPRAQTASPGATSARVLTGPSPAPPPPARPATAIDLSEPPKKPPMRVRSNLVPLDTTSAPTTPTSSTTPLTAPLTSGLNGPPSARLKAQTKRNIRNRYVDVFQQQTAAS